MKVTLIVLAAALAAAGAHAADPSQPNEKAQQQDQGKRITFLSRGEPTSIPISGKNIDPASMTKPLDSMVSISKILAGGTPDALLAAHAEIYKDAFGYCAAIHMPGLHCSINSLMIDAPVITEGKMVVTARFGVTLDNGSIGNAKP